MIKLMLFGEGGGGGITWQSGCKLTVFVWYVGKKWGYCVIYVKVDLNVDLRVGSLLLIWGANEGVCLVEKHERDLSEEDWGKLGVGGELLLGWKVGETSVEQGLKGWGWFVWGGNSYPGKQREEPVCDLQGWQLRQS